MKCPFCRETTTDIYNSRTTRFNTKTWRRRRCLSCLESFTTYEQPDLGFLEVKPSSGATERYSRAHLFSGIYSAFIGSKTQPETIDAVTDTVEAKILDLRQPTVESNQIASIILTTLSHFDTPAFLRYLSTHADLTSKAQLRRQLKNY